MKRIALIGIAAMGFSFIFAAPALAQEAGHEDAKPAESKPAEAKPAPKPAAKQHTAPKTQEQKPQEAKPESGARQEEHPEHAENKSTPKPTHNDAAHNDATHREATRTSTHTTTTKTTTTSVHRIPDDKYRANFGREHRFHVGHPEFVGGRSHFSYGGYGFYYSEPWPSGWGYDDDVYVVDIDGTYYLMDAVHPGVQLALVIDL